MTAQARARVGYLGPTGTFSEEALLSSAAPNMIEPVGLASIYETIDALRRREVEWALVPIENLLEGSINVTLDLLAGEASDVRIVGEALLRVRHSLIAAEPTELAEIDTVLTHPQVPGQCTAFLRDELARAHVVPASSTAEAVRTVVSERRRGQAAIGTLLAAQVYGGTVIREGIEDRADNETRFAWLARGDGEDAALPPLRASEIASATWKTSLVFWGLGAKRPGWLLRCLATFARREINLTKIESRPRREQLGDYMFFVDIDGSLAEPRLTQAVDALAELCEEVHVLGSYPAAAPAAQP
ncbi:MAG TPA: prephenate dehydratase [Solirubrobacteraceae bacterium]|jgi:prephenate dehydratase|nr:prephenate dehydratase [Solirubrobacteraceae bacterium]